MPDPHELDLKLLDRALEKHVTERQVFARDAKIAALVFLVFLFGIFFRFVDLSDQRLGIEARLKDVGEAQAAVVPVKDGLGRIGEILKNQGSEVAEAVTKGRDILRSRIVALNDDLLKLERAGPFEQGDSKAPSPPEGAVQSAGVAGSPPKYSPESALNGLSDEQLKTLRQGNREEYAAMIRTIVNGRIVPRVFDELNKTKADRLDRLVDDAIKSMAGPLAIQNPVLKNSGWKPGTTRATLDELSKALHEFHFKPPSSDDWWQTIESKGRSFQEVRADAEQAFSHLREGLAAPQKSLTDLDRAIATLAADAAQNKADLDSRAKALDKDYLEVQSLIGDVAKPLAAVAMEPGTVVRYAPAILAATLAYFLLRYLSLAKRQESLAQECRELGYSERAVQLYFDMAAEPATAVSPTTMVRWLPQQSSGLLLFAAAGLLAVVAAGRILTSPSLKNHAPWFLYALMFSALAVTYVRATTDRFLRPRLSHA